MNHEGFRLTMEASDVQYLKLWNGGSFPEESLVIYSLQNRTT